MLPIDFGRLNLPIQGLPSQSDTSNSSVLADLNVIKTTSLIISYRKPLHNSFCIQPNRLLDLVQLCLDHLFRLFQFNRLRGDF